MKLEIPVKADFDDIQDMIDEIKRLQTYKLFEGDDMVLVDLDAVVAVMANHVKADKCSESQNSWIPVSKELPSAEPEIIRCKDCRNRDEDECPMRHIERIEWEEDGYIEIDDIVHDYTEPYGYCDKGECNE